MNTKQKPTQLIEMPAQTSALTPMSMLDKAIVSGASIEVLEKLLALQERYEANQARKAFDNAMADARAEIPVIIKNQQVGYENKNSSGKTSYMHEDMAQIARTIDPIIAKNGLSYRFRTTSANARVAVTCVISHRDGHFEENFLDAGLDSSGGKNAIQGLGSALTYLQRYSLKAALGLAAAADDDGRAYGEVTRAPAQRSRVPSPSDAETEAKANPEPPQPQLIKGGKDAAAWTDLYIEAVLTSDSPATVMAWIDANQSPLGRITPELAKQVTTATENHLAFLRKTAPKEDPISSGVPKPAVMPNIDTEYELWMGWALGRIGLTDAGDDMDALFESFDAFWSDLKKEDQEHLLGARKAREKAMEP